MPPTDLFGLVGQRVDNIYRIDRAVGEGGSSVVYRGMHLGLGEPIAIKCLKLQTTLDSQSIETFTRRFRDEGRLLYRLAQGNLDIVRCIASGTTVSTSTGALVPFTVLEWLEGRSVSQDFRARRHKAMKGRTLEETMAMFGPAVLALDHAHRQGVVHRDVKPGNLYLQARPDGGLRIKVLDFGLAKILDETIGITMAATAGGFMMCSPRYAAPEQFNPQMGQIGPWTDVYSVALVLLESMRDQPVRRGDGMVAGMVEALEPSADLSATALGLKVPVHVERALLRAVSLDPKKRYATAGELWVDLGGRRPQATGPISVATPEVTKVMDRPRLPQPDRFGSTLAMENAPRNMTPGQMPAVRTAPLPAAGMPPPGPERRPTPMPASWSAPPASPVVRSGAPISSVPPASPPAPARRDVWSSAPPGAAGAQQAPVVVPPLPPPWTPPPPAPVASRPRRKGRAGLVLFLLFAAAVLATGGFYGWRAWQAHQARLLAP